MGESSAITNRTSKDDSREDSFQSAEDDDYSSQEANTLQSNMTGENSDSSGAK